MAKQPPKLKVIWEELELPDTAERLAAAFEMLLAGEPSEVPVQNGDLDSNAVADNDQIANPHKNQSISTN